jgi:hypothetical protein
VLLTPVPATAIAGAALVALLTTVTVELNVPVLFGAKTMCMIADCPAANVAPLMPLVTLYAVEPVMLTPAIVTLEFPLFVNVTGSVVLSPTVSFPKLSCDIDDTRLVVELEPAPLRGTVTSTVPLTFLMVNAPLKVPDVVGLNPTAKYVVAPGASERGRASEPRLNIELLIEALVTVRLDVVTFLMASVCVLLFPIGTAPNDTDDGVDVSRDDDTGLVGELVVLPFRGTVTRTVPLPFFMVRVPVKVPDVVGLNPTAKYVVPPALIENGSGSALMLNTELLIVAVVTVRADEVTFLIASVRVTLFPNATVPKDTDEGVEASEEARELLGVITMLAMPNKTAAIEVSCRRK